ncbi:DUF1569 domain-containing protein [Aestuariivivens sediminicola]|uniref:DUF1569 domain-containing protein n=1 Tax=Aestuariivivens sediminicola TaxID=2913560 RepID=UPI001F571D2B|nr:DUF1569 domain-containing protein [Aestuariivivens sediminicola]
MNSEFKRVHTLNQLLTTIEAYIPLKDEKATSVSKATVGWQLDHSLKVFNAVSHSIANSDPKAYRRQFNFWRTVLFPICYIPRGRARAPKFVLPPEVITSGDLKDQITMAKRHIEILKSLPKRAYFKHFVFGMLSKHQTLRFLEMHTKHHLKIVKDILSVQD